MDIIDLFNSGLLELPRDRSEEDYEKFLRVWMDEFISEIETLSGGDWVTQQLKGNRDSVKILCERIQEAFGAYYLGFPHRAYENLREAINGVDSWLRMLGSVGDISNSLQFLYRVRIGSLSDYKRRDLFHVPFEKRHVVKPQRYSISGLPSLYLGGSIWLCWEELGRPSFDQMQISRFKAIPDSQIHVLDFGFRPAVIAAFIATHPAILQRELSSSKFVLAHAICWPLFAACSVRVKHADCPYIPEYVVPQLLLQWIRNESDFHGIRYFSSRISQYVDSPEPAANYVFPVRTKRPDNFCDMLATSFALSRPMAWPVVQNTDMNSVSPPSGVPQWKLKLNPDLEIPYWHTEFYRCEAKINSLPCDYVLSD